MIPTNLNLDSKLGRWKYQIFIFPFSVDEQTPNKIDSWLFKTQTIISTFCRLIDEWPFTT